jgi:hypothetical protein
MNRLHHITAHIQQSQQQIQTNKCSQIQLETVVIVAVSRTPIGGLNGQLASFTAPQLASFAIKGKQQINISNNVSK